MMKCIVMNCENHSHEGRFVGQLCGPCYTFLSEGRGKYSQLWRNTVLKERMEQAQAIADIVEHHLDLGHDQHMIVNAIMHSYVEKLS